ncbi:hypothetical protein GE061_007110 [Apolygus lucorum]|uniref:Uncharacterized protein n=1 Tax=Apolygus lucorum TaxID=248454 RepID=A0A8S9WUN9_APOLU|nr:hypothetical protein GE061_007110 [Apolygus lucorum]
MIEDQWATAQKRAEERNLEHTNRLKTPAMYALEVYLGVFSLEGLDAVTFPDDDVRVRFKLLDFACVEVKRLDDAESAASPSSASSPSSPSSPGTSSSPSSPTSPEGTDTESPDADPKSVEAKPKDDSKKEEPKNEPKTDSKRPSTEDEGKIDPSKDPKKEEQKKDVKKEPSKTEVQPEGSKTDVKPDDGKTTIAPTAGGTVESMSSRTLAKERLKRDPRYFDPRKLLKQKVESPQTLNEVDGGEEEEGTTEGGHEEAPSSVGGPSSTAGGSSVPSGGTQSKRGSLVQGAENAQVSYQSGSGKAEDNTQATGTALSTAGSSQAAESTQAGTISQPGTSSQAATSSLAETSYQATTGSQGAISSPVTGTESPEPVTEAGTSGFSTAPPTEDGLGEAADEVEKDISFIHFENGKSVIFCQQPLSLLSSLPRCPLIFIFFRPPSQVLGIARVPLSDLADAVDKSISFTRSIPLSGIIRDTYDIFNRGRKVGMVNVDVRLSCFGPFLLHKIYVRDNPNEKGVQNLQPRRTSSQRLIVVEMSNANLGEIRNKSKIFVSKSNPVLVGKVQRDISHLPPIVCADENLLDPPSKPKVEITIVEEEERRKEEARLTSLSQFPQYKCIDDWEVIFTRNVIKDLIAKNRRPFQKGSADRKYVKSYFPELMPQPKLSPLKQLGRSKSNDKLRNKRDHCNCSDCRKGGGDKGSLLFLPLDKAWAVENINRIRRKSLRPPVKTSFSAQSPLEVKIDPPISAVSGVSMVKLPFHTDKSMSHVAVSHFNMEKGSVDTGEEDSRAAGPKIRKKSSIDDNSGQNHGKVFNTKYPRINWSLEKYNPLPQKPYMIELQAPERYPTDKLVQAIKVYRKQVEDMGGDTKMLHDTEEVPCDGHLKRNIRANLSPETSDGGDIDTDKSVLLEVEKGVPMAIHARSTPYWAGHAPVCDDPANCKHFLLLHPGFGFYGK